MTLTKTNVKDVIQAGFIIRKLLKELANRHLFHGEYLQSMDIFMETLYACQGISGFTK